MIAYKNLRVGHPSKRLLVVACALISLLMCSCSRTESSLASSIRHAGHLSDVFVDACVKTNLDLARVRLVAALAKLRVPDKKFLSQFRGFGGGLDAVSAWRVDAGGRSAVLVAGSMPKDSALGRKHDMSVCVLNFLGELPQDFIKRVRQEAGLKVVDPAHYRFRRDDRGKYERLSETGLEDGSLEVMFMQDLGRRNGRLDYITTVIASKAARHGQDGSGRDSR